MVENTIQAIKETEAKADAVVREAESKYREILDEAAKKAEAAKDAVSKTKSENAQPYTPAQGRRTFSDQI